MKIPVALTSLLACISIICKAQYSPAAGVTGSIAVHASDTKIKAWAKTCKTTRGYRDISKPDSGYASAGTDTMATGPALQNGMVSLGDKGFAVLTLPYSLHNGAGYDFAVFENSFSDSFLELAFVEVSSDGKRYVRFPAVSLTDTLQQVGSFGSTDCRKINNLAGSFRAGYGTPFDLDELKDSGNIDLNNINYIKIIDVCGSIDAKYRSVDSKGNPVNDPWPTNFPSSGFDLDAVALLQGNPLNVKSHLNTQTLFFPNPQTVTSAMFHTSLDLFSYNVNCFNMMGQKIEFKKLKNSISFAENISGTVYVHLQDPNNNYKIILSIIQ